MFISSWGLKPRQAGANYSLKPANVTLETWILVSIGAAIYHNSASFPVRWMKRIRALLRDALSVIPFGQGFVGTLVTGRGLVPVHTNKASARG